MQKLIFAVVAGLLACSAHAEIYKWVDKDGRVHYGDRPKTTPAEQVPIDRAGFDAEPVTPEEAAAAAARRAACEEATKEFEKYKAADVIKQTDAFGETRDFTAEERERFLAVTQQQKNAACGPPDAPSAAGDSDAGEPEESGDDLEEPDELDQEPDADFDQADAVDDDNE